jgi:MFS family permease
MFFSCNVAFSSMPVFLPTILHDMGYHSITSQALTAPPYLFSFVIVLLTAYHSDRLQSRSTFVILHSLLATTGYGTIAICGYFQSPNTLIRYLALYPAAAGFFSAITIIITWTINNQESETGKGTGVVVMNMIGQLGPLVGTSIFPKEDGPYYVRGMAICGSFMAVVGVLAMILRWVLVRENRKSQDGVVDEYAGIPLEDGGMVRKQRVFRYMV